jgi:hypothetical protein
VRNDSSTEPTCSNKVANPRGAAVTDLTGEQRHLCREHSHLLVAGGAAAGTRLGNWVSLLNHFGPQLVGWPL